MQSRFSILVVSLFLTTAVFAREFTISGYVQDGKTGERLIGVNVFYPEFNIGTTTNVYGFFSLTKKDAIEDSITLVVAYIGYKRWQQNISSYKDLDLQIEMTQQAIAMDSVMVVAEQLESIEQKTEMSTIEVPIRQLKAMPALLGEVDVIKSIQLLPGVQSGSEGSSGLYVRGGAPDQNLILLDGAPVYNVSHLFGFFSVFNADAVKNIKLIKGGFPARYGGRLSSVVEINMKEGNNQEFNAQATIGLISSRAMLEGPLKKDKTSFIVSARRTYVDMLMKPFLEEDEKAGYYFTDVNAKVNHIFSAKNRLYFSVYTGLDKFYFDGNEDEFSRTSSEKGDLKWGNITSTMRWNYLVNKKLFSNTTLLYSRYRFEVNVEEKYRYDGQLSESFFLQYFSGIKDWSARIDFDYRPTPAHYIKFGLGGTAHTFSPGAAQFKVEGFDVSDIDTLVAPTRHQNANEANVYLEDDITLTDRLKINAGVHGSLFSINNKTYTSLQPRISLRYLLNAWAVKTSYANMRQYVHLLSNAGIGMPTDLWVPATDRIRPQRSEQFAFGLARSFRDKQYEFSLESYHKSMSNLIEYKEGADFLGLDTDWQNKVETGSGRSYGVEFFVQKKRGRTTGWLGYTLSWTDRKFTNLNFGKRYPYRYDRRHDISFVFNRQLKPGIELSGTWVYGSGNAITLPEATYPSVLQMLPWGSYMDELDHLPEKNGVRMRAYHRFDLGIRFIKTKGVLEGGWTIGVYNVYSRKNPFFYFLSERDNGDRVVKQASLFPLIPAVSFTKNF